MTIATPIVDWGALAQAVYLSVGIGLAVLLVASFAVMTSLRAADAREDRRGSTVAVMGAATVLLVGVLAAGIVGGIYVMTLK